MAQLAEIIGAVAVVVSLVYVGIQVNDSVGASRSASVNDANVALQNWYLEVGTNEQASTLFYRGLMSREALPAEERRRLAAFLVSLRHKDLAGYRARMADKIDDKTPEKWLTLEEMDQRIGS